MGLPMSHNLVKKGFEVKAYDIDPVVLEKCKENVSILRGLLFIQGVKPVRSVGESSTDVK